MSAVSASWASTSSGGRSGVLVHGGAGARAEAAAAEHARGCRAAADAAFAILAGGGSSLDAVERAVLVLEDDPRFNAGYGAALTEDGTVELDASIMDGRGLRAGAVGALVGFRNAVLAARAVLEDGRHVFQVGAGAARIALASGVPEVDPASLVTEGARESLARALARRVGSMSGGTVGAVAFDGRGNVAAATSTGGISGKRSGRVGDSPVIGAGTYADGARGAASATGEGEGIIRVALTHGAVLELGRSDSEQAARGALETMFERAGARGGLILVDAHGRFALARSTETMPWAFAGEGGLVQSGY